MLLKRLAYFLRNMDQDTHTYPEMYDAELFVVDPERLTAAPDKCFDPIYYNEDIGFKITGTHKLAQDKPTVTINIPIEMLSMEEDTLQSYTSAAAADHCLRKFAPYIDGLTPSFITEAVPTAKTGNIIFTARRRGALPQHRILCAVSAAGLRLSEQKQSYSFG